MNKKEGKVKSRLTVVCSVCGAEITHCNKCSKIFEYNEIIICEKTRHYHKDCNDKKSSGNKIVTQTVAEGI